MVEQLERLLAAGIEAAPVEGMARHAVVARDGYAALVECDSNKLGRIGAAGLMTSYGLAQLIWRDGSALFVAKGHEQRASEEQVAALRRFARDIERALADVA